MKINICFLKVLLLCSLLLINCSDENPVESRFAGYQGTWLWVRTVGGVGPRVSTPREGTSIKINYDNLGVFRKYRNDSLKVTARYYIEPSEYDRDKISYFNVTTCDFHFNSVNEYAKVHTDTLELWDGAIDGFFSFYKKIN